MSVSSWTIVWMTSDHTWSTNVVSDHVVVMALKGKPIGLNFTDPGSGGPYGEITWYKGSSRRSRDKIVSLTRGKLRYYNEYCSEISSCKTSRKGQLNTTTGELTIHQVELSDDAYYFYSFYGVSYDTGWKYEINLTVSGKRHYLSRVMKITTLSSISVFLHMVKITHLLFCIIASFNLSLIRPGYKHNPYDFYVDQCDSSQDSTQCAKGEICSQGLCLEGF